MYFHNKFTGKQLKVRWFKCFCLFHQIHHILINYIVFFRNLGSVCLHDHYFLGKIFQGQVKLFDISDEASVFIKWVFFNSIMNNFRINLFFVLFLIFFILLFNKFIFTTRKVFQLNQLFSFRIIPDNVVLKLGLGALDLFVVVAEVFH